MSYGFTVGNTISKQFEMRLEAAKIEWEIWSGGKHTTEYTITKDSDRAEVRKILEEIRLHNS